MYVSEFTLYNDVKFNDYELEYKNCEESIPGWDRNEIFHIENIKT